MNIFPDKFRIIFVGEQFIFLKKILLFALANLKQKKKDGISAVLDLECLSLTLPHAYLKRNGTEPD